MLQGYLLDDRIVPMVGIRHDVDKAGFANGGTTPDPSSHLVPFAPGYGPLTQISQTTKTYGVVVHPLKWLNVFYNHSQNFIPNAGSIDLQGAPTPNPTGTSKDYGVSADLLDNKLNVKIDWYKTIAANGPATSVNFPTAQWTIPFLERGAFLDLAQKAGVANYNQGLAPDIVVGDPRLANAYTSDQQAKGVEFELTYNVNKNWRIFATITRQEAVQKNIAAKLDAYIDARIAYWQSIPGIWNGTTNKDWSGQPETGQFIANNLKATEIGWESQEGVPSPQIHKWRGTLVTNYMFDQAPLKGFSIGTGLRFLDQTVIGLPPIYGTVNGARTVVAMDVAHPFTTPSEVSVDAWIGYKHKLFDKYIVSFQLRGQDLQSPGSYRAVSANSDGTHATFQIVQPRTFYLTTTIDF